VTLFSISIVSNEFDLLHRVRIAVESGFLNSISPNFLAKNRDSAIIHVHVDSYKIHMIFLIVN
jgi:hypothetical protein